MQCPATHQKPRLTQADYPSSSSSSFPQLCVPTPGYVDHDFNLPSSVPSYPSGSPVRMPAFLAVLISFVYASNTPCSPQPQPSVQASPNMLQERVNVKQENDPNRA